MYKRQALWPRYYQPPAEAARFYRTGTEDLEAGANFAATKELGEAVRLAPDFSMAHARLAQAWTELDSQGKASREMQLARRYAADVYKRQRKFRVVVNKSTVPVGSGNLVETLVREGIRDAHPDGRQSIRFGVASNPEFLREGSAIFDSLYPDRIVLGADVYKRQHIR